MITPEERAELTREITEHILQLLPGVISHLINNMVTMKELSTHFYETNKDLVQHKQVVGTVIEQLEFKHPGKPMQEILELAANETRKVLSQQRNIGQLAPAGVNHLDRVLGNL